jgi:hypothetical protein
MDYATDEYVWLLNEVNWVRSQVHIKYPKGNNPISYGDVIELPDPNVRLWGRPDVLHEYAHCVLYTNMHIVFYTHYMVGFLQEVAQIYVNVLMVITISTVSQIVDLLLMRDGLISCRVLLMIILTIHI